MSTTPNPITPEQRAELRRLHEAAAKDWYAEQECQRGGNGDEVHRVIYSGTRKVLDTLNADDRIIEGPDDEGYYIERGRENEVALAVAARNALPGLLDALDAAEAERDALIEALTPSAETKHAYMGEFDFEERADHCASMVWRIVPWTTIKDIMAFIRKRAALRTDAGAAFDINRCSCIAGPPNFLASPHPCEYCLSRKAIESTALAGGEAGR